MLIIQLGLVGGWASPNLARLVKDDSPLPLNMVEASWVASLVNLGRFFGALVGAISMNYFGSKRSIFFTLIPMSLGWVLVIFANKVQLLYAARISGGFALGMAFSTFPLYMGEVSMPEVRGALISLATTGGPIGQLLASVFCAYLSITASSLIFLCLCLFTMFIFCWLPESPHHLVKLEKLEPAIKSITWYRNGEGVKEEFEAILKFVASANTKTFIEKCRESRTPAMTRALTHVIILFFFMQACGLNSILFYMEIILTRARFTMIDPANVVIYANIFAVIASIASIFLIDRCGRRFLLIVSSIGCTIGMLGLGTSFAFGEVVLENYDNLISQWALLLSMVLYIISFFVGLMPVPSTILSEIFPTNLKCIAACIASLTSAATAFMSSKTYQPLVDFMGESYMFYLYAAGSTLILPYTILCIPETKGKSLQQIQDELIKKKAIKLGSGGIK